ncbi:MAG: hypothetical protein WAZ14_00220 [Patescibacteria group bacterium]
MAKGSTFIIKLYFAVISAVTIITLMYGLIDFVSLGLKTYVFKAADVPSYLQTCGDTDYYNAYYGKPVAPDSVVPATTAEQAKADCERNRADTLENYDNQKANDAVRDFALVLVSLPLFLIHFRFVYRDWKEDRG